MEKIKIDKKNFRIHGEKNKSLIRKSLNELGAGRSIVLDNDNVIIAGNGVFEQAKYLGLNVKIIESDGKELFAIKRTDLTTNDEKRKLLALADNKTSDTSEFDLELLNDEFSNEILNDWDIEIQKYDSIDYSDKNKEINIDEFPYKMEMKFVLSQNEFMFIQSELSKIDSSKENALLKLLNYGS